MPGMPGSPSNPNGSTSQPGVGVFGNRDFTKRDTHDRPAGVARFKVPDPNGNTPGLSDGNGNGSNGGNVPPGEDPPGSPPPEDPPTFYGEPVFGKFAFILDASGSMAGSRIAALRAEATNAINGLTDDDELDVMSFGTQFPDFTCELWGALQPATDGNRANAVSFINGAALDPGGGTPSHRALEKACGLYPADLGRMFFLSDGGPNATGTAGEILAHFPAWWAKFEQETALIVICIGGDPDGVSFMRDLAALDDSTGQFNNVP